MDGEIFQGEATDGNADISRDQTARHRHSDVRLQNHSGIDRAHGLIWGWTVTSAAARDGAELRNDVAKDNTASTVWADSSYRSKTNEEWLKDNGLTSDIRKRPVRPFLTDFAGSTAGVRRSG